jgi:hypothetical protein
MKYSDRLSVDKRGTKNKLESQPNRAYIDRARQEIESVFRIVLYGQW